MLSNCKDPCHRRKPPFKLLKHGCVLIQVMVASVEAVVLSQLIMMCCGVDFSNVHSLNAVRMAGVLAATFNGMYATFVLWHFRDDPAARPPCTMTAPNNGIDGSSSSLQSTTSLELVNDYSTFFGLIGVNVGAIAYGAMHCARCL
jgi:hypothetical protein